MQLSFLKQPNYDIIDIIIIKKKDCVYVALKLVAIGNHPKEKKSQEKGKEVPDRIFELLHPLI